VPAILSALTKLGIEEDFFVNYGFVTRSLQALMHPRSDNCVGQGQPAWPAARRKRAQLLLDFVANAAPYTRARSMSISPMAR